MSEDPTLLERFVSQLKGLFLLLLNHVLEPLGLLGHIEGHLTLHAGTDPLRHLARLFALQAGRRRGLFPEGLHVDPREGLNVVHQRIDIDIEIEIEWRHGRRCRGCRRGSRRGWCRRRRG